MIEVAVRDGLSYRRSPAALARAGTLLLIHGLGESGLCFEGLLREERLGELDRVAVDLCGYGRSPWSPRAPLSLSEHADRLAEWITPLEPPIIIAGHSMGGVIGQLLFERHGARLRTLAGFFDIEGNISLGDCGFSAPTAEQALDEFVARGRAQLLERLYRAGGADRSLQTYFASVCLCDPRAYHRNSVELVEESEREDLAQRLAGLSQPAVYLAGVPAGASEHSLELLRIAGVDVVTNAPAGHWPFLDQPDAAAQVLAAFVDRCLSSPVTE